MKILHTSDWHIGKRLINRERLDEQAEVLDEIVAVCDNEDVELVLIAGDVFDTYTPSAEAEKLFYQKIKRLAGDNRAVVLISGLSLYIFSMDVSPLLNSGSISISNVSNQAQTGESPFFTSFHFIL